MKAYRNAVQFMDCGRSEKQNKENRRGKKMKV